ncbi:MAG: NAD/NADP octopine/nopaline dehydrogenase family protein [Solirubrobacterales bacterium]
MTVRSVAILGAGNGGCAAAADLAARGFEVRLYNRSLARLEPLVERGGLEWHGPAGEGFVELPVVTDDLGEAVQGSELVMLTVPISAYPLLAEHLGAVLPPDGLVFLNPGHMGGGLFLAHEIYRTTGRTDVRTCEVSTLAYACRMTGPTAVRILQVTPHLPFAAFPGKWQAESFELLQDMYPAIAEARDVLETGFMDINAVEHPPQIICNAGWLEHTSGDYLFYYEGTTPSVGRVIDTLDKERRAVASAAGVITKPFVQLFCDMGYTTEAAAASGTAYAALQASTHNRWIKAPPTLDHRYLHEDVGCGLVPWAELGGSLGVRTPLMDALITIGSLLTGRDYRSEGLTLGRLGLLGLGGEEVPTYLWEGIASRERAPAV